MSINAIWTLVTTLSRIARHWVDGVPAKLTFPFSYKGMQFRFTGEITRDKPKD